MKKLKIIFKLLCFIILCSIGTCFLMPTTQKSVSASDSIYSNTTFKAVTEEILEKYITISTHGQKLTYEQITNVSTNETYIYSNYDVSVLVKKPLSSSGNFISRFSILKDNSANHTLLTNCVSFPVDSGTINILEDGSASQYNYTKSTTKIDFASENNNFAFNISSNNQDDNSPTDPYEHKNIFYDNDSSSIEYVYSFTWFSNSDDDELVFCIGTSCYKIHFIKSKVNMNLDNFLTFICNGFDAGTEEYTYSKLPMEKMFTSVKIKFPNDYSENNPLYFNINYNGFDYKFNFYIKNSNLIVNYLTNDIKNPQNINSNGLLNYALTFNKLGRYEIEFYDNTYVQKMPALTYNYYKTSFYINESNSENIYENIYALFKSYGENIDEEYVANSSNKTPILNTNVKILIKNIQLIPDVDREKFTINIEKNISNGDFNETKTYSFNGVTLLNDNSTILCEDDAAYTILLKYENIEIRRYKFQIIKKAKTSFTVNGTTYQASKPYIKYTYNGSNNIDAEMQVLPSNNDSETNVLTLSQTYTNNYVIYYGQIRVSIEETTGESSMSVEFKGVGDITVIIEFNGEKTTKILSEDDKTLTFAEFGTYKLTMTDILGTEIEKTINFSKPLNTSTILLIVFSGILLLMIAAFVLISRKKVATR